jgi:hypothetical protein
MLRRSLLLAGVAAAEFWLLLRRRHSRPWGYSQRDFGANEASLGPERD